MNPAQSAERIAREICSIVRGQVDDSGAEAVPLHEPRFGGNEWRYVKECIDTGWVSSVGGYVDEFEERLAAYTNSRRAVVTVNGTSALQVALELAGVGEGDEVLVPALTFVATANAVTYRRAVPHFVDCEPSTLGVDPEALSDYLSDATVVHEGRCVNRATGRRIRAVVPMHTFGHPVDLDGLQSVCREYRLTMIEDAAESLGSLYRSEHTGTRGLFGVLSFNGNKTITTGGGGALLTDDADLADRAKHITTTAKRDHAWAYVHDRVGYNFRMPNINAALGCAQLEQLSDFLEVKRSLADHYATAFRSVEGLHFVTEPEHGRSNYWLNAVLLEPDLASERGRILELTNGAGIRTRPAWTLMTQLPMYRDCPAMPLPVSESLGSRLINLPSSVSLGREVI